VFKDDILKGTVALVTGGGTGIGLMAAQTLAANGSKVYITSRRNEAIENAAKQHGDDAPGQIIPIQSDVTTKEGIDKLVREISSRESHLDVLINSAGISGPKSDLSSKDDAKTLSKALYGGETFEGWSEVMNTNVSAVYFMSTAFLPLLRASTKEVKGHSGCIINIASISGLTKTAQGHFAYNTSKGATIHLTELMAQEFADLKIRVNAINPGYFPSEMTTKESDDRQKSQFDEFDHDEKGVPAMRPGKDEDMAAAVLVLICDQYINGHAITVDGGLLLKRP